MSNTKCQMSNVRSGKINIFCEKIFSKKIFSGKGLTQQWWTIQYITVSLSQQGPYNTPKAGIGITQVYLDISFNKDLRLNLYRKTKSKLRNKSILTFTLQYICQCIQKLDLKIFMTGQKSGRQRNPNAQGVQRNLCLEWKEFWTFSFVIICCREYSET